MLPATQHVQWEEPVSCPADLHMRVHARAGQAMFVDFGYAERYGGRCFLRFDDTNPEAEKQEYIDHIQDIVSWLGYKPYKARAGRSLPALHVFYCHACKALCHALTCLHMH